MANDSDLARRQRFWWGLVAAGVLIVLGYYAVKFWRLSRPRMDVTTSSVSPDGRYRVSLIETSPDLSVDRNFALTLTDLKTGAVSRIFESPDEGRPPGTERFVWSAGGDAFALFGRHFVADKEFVLASGECFYLLYHVPTAKLWCNASQSHENRMPISELVNHGIGAP